MKNKQMNLLQIILVGSVLTVSASTSAIAAEKQTFEAETAELIP